MTTPADVEYFLDHFNHRMDLHGVRFIERRKNRKALFDLELVGLEDHRVRYLRELTANLYSEGPLKDDRFGVGPYWVFGKKVRGVEVYVKISVGDENGPVCISFHKAERPMHKPFIQFRCRSRG